MKTRPIPFSAPMVRAILNGSKTQTRRVIKHPPLETGGPLFTGWYHPTVTDRFGDEQPGEETFGAWTEDGEWSARCPFGQPGDGLWVREAWKAHTTFDHLPPREIPETHVWYMADDGYKAESRYRHGRFMPRWASRINLEIVGVRAERLQDISEADIRAEGDLKNMFAHAGANPRGAFSALFDSLNGAGSWDANPWVWVIEFRKLP